MAVDVPVRIVSHVKYEFSLPGMPASPLSSSCGTVQHVSGNSWVLDAKRFSGQAGTICTLSENGTALWNVTASASNSGRSGSFKPKATSLTWPVGAPASIVLPQPFVIFNGFRVSPSLVYYCTPALPGGMAVNPHSGMISGTPVELGYQRTVTCELSDSITHGQIKVAVLTITVVSGNSTNNQAAASSNSQAVSIGAGLGGGGGGALLVVLVVMAFLLRRAKDRLKQKPFNFAEMLDALQSLALEQTERRAPREIRRTAIKLLDVLGKGNFGEVRKGLISEIPGTPGYIVAVKTLHASLDADRGAILQEAALMAQFSSPFVVGLVGVVTVGEPLLVVLEYCEHGALNTYLETHDVAERDKHRLAADCAEGLAYLTLHGFIHRDVAARNILLSSERRCKIADFGMSRETIDSNYYLCVHIHVRLLTALQVQGRAAAGALDGAGGPGGAQVQPAVRLLELRRAAVRDLDQGRPAVQGHEQPEGLERGAGGVPAAAAAGTCAFGALHG